MTNFTSHILPTLEAFGVWSYWIIGLASLLEGWWLTSIIVPGTLIVDAGGALARLGHLGVIDLAWFVAIGAILGGEVSWVSGRWLGERVKMPTSGAFARAQELTRKRGGQALILGRFLGPVAGFVPLAAALAGMERRRFVRWNIASGAIYAVGHLAIGYLAGDILARVGPYLPRMALPLALLTLLVAVTWIVTHHVRRGWPALRCGASALRRRLLIWPPARAFVERHPQAATFLADHLHPERGLLLSAAIVLVLYLVGVFIDGALDLAFVPETEALDQRVANLAHAYWTDSGLTLASWLTQLGHVPVATLVALGAVLGLALWGRRASAIGLAVAVVGNATTVTLMKLAFGRDRPTLSYFLETSYSFPSGHAAISVALYGTLAMMLWRERLIGPTMAIAGGVAMAAGIGATRLYLVEHFLSDVLNGWVVGSIWLVIGLALAQGLDKRVSMARPCRALAGIALALCVGGGAWFAVHDVKSPQTRGLVAQTVLTDPATQAGTPDLPLEVTDLAGDTLPSVSLVVMGLDPDQAVAALDAGGWTPVPDPDLWSISAALWSDLTGHPSPAATVPPAFRAATPASATLSSADASVVLRLWEAGRLQTGDPVLAIAVTPAEDTPPQAAVDAQSLADQALVAAGAHIATIQPRR